MQLKQDIKGFTILELLVVITIVAIVSAVGYPNFMDWQKERTVRATTEKVATMLTGISTQAQKGYFPFVQFQVTPGLSNVVFTSKGMTQDTMSIKLNQSSTKSLDCTIVNSGYWDNHLVDTYTAEVGVNISGSGAVCFSKDGSYFSEKNKLEDKQVTRISIGGRQSNNYLIICLKGSSGGGLIIVGGGSGSCAGTKHQYLVEWSRFGNIKKYKWSGSDWNRK